MTQLDDIAEQNDVCRKIVREINDFKINDRQKAFLCYLLALELEKPDVGADLITVLTSPDAYCFSLIDYAESTTKGDEGGKTG